MGNQTLVLETYKMLRSEIEQKTNSQDTLLTFTDTSVVTIIGIITAINHPLPPEVYWIPLAIIVPMQFRFVYYRESIAKLATYIACFLEPRLPDYMRWETKQLDLDQQPSRKHTRPEQKQVSTSNEYNKSNKFTKGLELCFIELKKRPFFKRPLIFFDFLILSLVCSGIYVAQIYPFQVVDSLLIFKIGFLLIVETIIVAVTFLGTNLTRSRRKWRSLWLDLQRENEAAQKTPFAPPLTPHK